MQSKRSPGLYDHISFILVYFLTHKHRNTNDVSQPNFKAFHVTDRRKWKAALCPHLLFTISTSTQIIAIPLHWNWEDCVRKCLWLRTPTQNKCKYISIRNIYSYTVKSNSQTRSCIEPDPLQPLL